jgi:hypothetical protein
VRIGFVIFAILFGVFTAAKIASAEEAEAWTALRAWSMLPACAIPIRQVPSAIGRSSAITPRHSRGRSEGSSGQRLC